MSNKPRTLKKGEICYQEYTIPIYGYRLIVVFAVDTPTLKKEFDIPDSAVKDDYDCYACAISSGDWAKRKTIYAVFKPESLQVGILAHEAIHCADYVFDWIGATHDPDNPEPYCYLVEWFAQQMYDCAKAERFIT